VPLPFRAHDRHCASRLRWVQVASETRVRHGAALERAGLRATRALLDANAKCLERLLAKQPKGE